MSLLETCATVPSSKEKLRRHMEPLALSPPTSSRGKALDPRSGRW